MVPEGGNRAKVCVLVVFSLGTMKKSVTHAFFRAVERVFERTRGRETCKYMHV